MVDSLLLMFREQRNKMRYSHNRYCRLLSVDIISQVFSCRQK